MLKPAPNGYLQRSPVSKRGNSLKADPDDETLMTGHLRITRRSMKQSTSIFLVALLVQGREYVSKLLSLCRIGLDPFKSVRNFLEFRA